MARKKKIEKPVEKSNDTLILCLGIIGIIFYVPYYTLYYSYRIIYWTFFRIPGRPSFFYGLFRSSASFGILSNFEHELMSKSSTVQEWFDLHSMSDIGSVLLFGANVILLIGFFNGLLVATGICRSLTIPDTGNTVYSNIRECFQFRDGVLEQLSTRQKVEEGAKTGFSMESQFQNPRTENEREMMEFLDTKMGMESTRGKYELLKDLYSGGKDKSE